MNTVNLVLFIASFFLTLVPFFNLVSFFFAKKEFEERFFVSFIFLLFIASYLATILSLFSLFSQIKLIVFFLVLSAASITLNKRFKDDAKKSSPHIAFFAFIILFNTVFNLVAQNALLVNILAVVFSAATFLYYKKDWAALPAILSIFFLLGPAIGALTEMSDTHHYVYATQSIMQGRLPSLEIVTGGHVQFFGLLEQSYFAILAKMSGLPAPDFFFLGFLTLIAWFFAYLNHTMKKLGYGQFSRLVFFVFLALFMDIQVRPRLFGGFLVAILILDLLHSKYKDKFSWFKITMLLCCIILTHATAFLAILPFLFLLFLIGIKMKKKSVSQLVALAVIFTLFYSAIWWVPVYIKYKFRYNSFWTGVLSDPNFDAGKASWKYGPPKLVVLFILSIICVGLLEKDFMKKTVFVLFSTCLLAFLFHDAITLPLLGKHFAPEKARRILYMFWPTVVMLTTNLLGKLKIEGFKLKKEYVALFFIIIFIPEFVSHGKWYFSLFDELRRGLVWNGVLKKFTQDQENLDAYAWILENTNRDDVFLNPDEYVITNDDIRTADRQSLFISDFTGRMSYVISHNYASYAINMHERYPVANYVLYGDNETMRQQALLFSGADFVATNKLKDGFVPFNGLEPAFENKKFAIYKVTL